MWPRSIEQNQQVTKNGMDVLQMRLGQDVLVEQIRLEKTEQN